MKRLRDVAKLIRSKNAGPFVLTLDIVLADRGTYERLEAAETITPEVIAGLYGVDVADVHVIPYAPGQAIKISFPRPIPSGDLNDYDVMGGQQYAPIVDLLVPV